MLVRTPDCATAGIVVQMKIFPYRKNQSFHIAPI
jgi:hypothetical protein